MRSVCSASELHELRQPGCCYDLVYWSLRLKEQEARQLRATLSERPRLKVRKDGSSVGDTQRFFALKSVKPSSGHLWGKGKFDTSPKWLLLAVGRLSAFSESAIMLTSDSV